MSLVGYTYHGSKENTNLNCSFYCYLIYDKIKDMYYSGSRGIKGSNEHDLFKTYFTSSSVRDFVQRMKNNPQDFDFLIEYFSDRELAFKAEENFHKLYNVRKNIKFYNQRNCNEGIVGTTASVLCKDKDGNIYRVSSDEYKTGKHNHVCTDRLIVRDKKGNTKSIKKDSFDEKIYNTQFSNYVLCYDKITKKNKRIPRDIFNSDERYIGITKGKVSAYDILENKSCSIPKELFEAEPDRYIGISKGTFPVINTSTGKTEIIKKTDYDRTKYKHSNSGKTVQFSLVEKKNISITTEEYEKSPHLYANTVVKYFCIVDGIIFTDLKVLKEYVKKHYNMSIPRMKTKELGKNFNFIKVISKQEFIDGNYKNQTN